jgi:hypothetical protein
MNRSTLAPILLAFLFIPSAYSFYAVYNLRISQLTRRQASAGIPSLITSNIFQQWYAFRDTSKVNLTGLLLSYIYSQPSWYIKLDAAGAHVHSISPDCTEFKGNQSDDFLLSGGYGIQPRKGSRMTFSGYFGIPTHRDTALDGAEFGTGHYSIGTQIDGSQTYNIHKPHFVLWAIRSLYFFPRTIGFADSSRPERYKLSPGNVMDIYIAHQSNWGTFHRIEFGYDCTFSLGTKIYPYIDNFGTGLPFVRNTYFVSYIRNIHSVGKQSSLLFTLTYGADARPRLLGRKYGVSLFISWAVNF